MAGAHYTADATVAASHAVAVVKSDATIIPATRALYIGTAGNLTVRMVRTGVTVLFSNVPVGIFPVQVDKVMSTGTAAADVVALY